MRGGGHSGTHMPVGRRVTLKSHSEPKQKNVTHVTVDNITIIVQ